nr:putative speedy protein-like protein 3 isoform X2 [Saimiri boliviensis boliviensis]
MARCQPQPQLEERSPQPSTSGCSLLEVIDVEVPGPSVPWVDPGTPSKFLCWNRKREWSDQSEEPPKEETEKERAPEPEETWVLDTLCGLKMKLKRRRVSPVLPEHCKAFNTLLAEGVCPSSPWFLCRKRKREWSDESEEETEEEPEKERTPEPEETWVLETLQGLKVKLKRRRVSPVLPEHHQAFNRLLEDPVVKRFLAWDKDLRVSDKYLLAMVIAYFSRAGLFSWQYQRIHFFLALYLANDMEEDDEDPKQAIFYFLYGKNNRFQRPLFQKLRFQFFCSMHCRAWVSPEELEEIQAYDPEHWVWARNRALLS